MDFLMQNQFHSLKNYYNFQFLEEEEEIEWIPNKDAFVFSMVELSAVVPTASHVSSRVRRARSKSGRKKRKSLEWAPPEKPEPGNAAGRECGHCKAEETPQWRAGPFGPKTLCNACGIRYKSGRLVPEYRPARSPTFSSELHSNSHRKIVEMMRMKEMESGFVFKHK